MLIFFAVSVFVVQSKENESVSKLLFMNNCLTCLDSLITIRGEEEILKELVKLNFNKKDTLRIDDKSIWERNSDFFGITGNAVQSKPNSLNMILNEPEVLSMNIKLIYWVCLIYSDSIHIAILQQNPNYGTALINRQSGKYLFDYENTGDEMKSIFKDNNVSEEMKWENLTFCKVKSNWLREIEESFHLWITLLNTKGLKYLRENKISPIDNKKYEFKLVKLDPWVLFVRRLNYKE